MTGNRHHRSGAAAPDTGATAALSGSTRRRFAGAARFVAAAALVCVGVEAQAQSFYLDDRNLAPNIIRVNAPAGTNVSGITPRVISGSTTIQNNVTYSLAGSDLFTVNAATGAIRSVGAFNDSHLGHYSMTLTAEHGGETDDFALHIGVHPVGGFYICDRTRTTDRRYPNVRDSILQATPANDTCNFVSEAAMAGIEELDFRLALASNRTMLDYDFWGVSGLQSLVLVRTNLTRMPPDIFAGLSNLNSLIFAATLTFTHDNIDLLELPARLLADLERPARMSFSVHPRVRMGGIQYRLAGTAEPITELALGEGSSVNLEIEVEGGVRSTLTLAFRSDNESLITATPATIKIPPFSNKATVMLETSVGLNSGGVAGQPVSWAWNQFNNRVMFTGFGVSGPYVNIGATELRAADLRVTVRDTSRFEDTTAAPNQISEAASPGDSVLGWSPQVLVRNVVVPNVRYSLPRDAGGLFAIDVMTGALSLASGRMLDYAASTFHEVTVAAQVTVDGDNLTASLAVPIEVLPVLVLRDTDSSTNAIASRVAPGTPVIGVTPEARLGGSIVMDGVVYSLDGPGGLFTVNTASGVISAAGPFMAGDIRAHPVTLTAAYRGNLASLPLTITVREGFPICDRTSTVRDRILALLNTPVLRYDCNLVPSDDLASIGTLTFPTGLRFVTELLPHDFNGMTGLENLDLSFSQITSLPENIFRDTTSLRVLNLGRSALPSLPENIFRDTPNLRELDMAGSLLTSLPENIFRDTPNLRELNLSGSLLTSLPPGIFMHPDSLESLDFLFTDLRELPARLLADLEKITPPVTIGASDGVLIGGVQYRLDGALVTDALTLDEGVRHRFQIEVAGGVRSTLTLAFQSNTQSLTASPATITFSPLSNTNTAVVELLAPPDLDFADRSGSVRWEWGMYTPANTGRGTAIRIPTQIFQVDVPNAETFFLEDTDPSPNTIALSAGSGTPVAGVMPAARIGRFDGVVAAVGVVYALDGGGLFTVNTASGVISSARPFTGGDSGRRPVTLTATYRNTVASLPLVIGVNPDGGFDICGRTPVVRDELLRLVNEGGGTSRDCTDVPAANLATIPTLDFSANPATDVRTLRGGDFDGLSGLTGLNLRALGLRRLPPDIFAGLANLRMLNLQDSRLTSLPAPLLADLEKPDSVTAGFDTGVLIGGVQYHIGGRATTELALDEEASRNLRIEVVGGVRSTLTLVARTGGAAAPAVTPETIRFSPGADAVIVQLTAPTDDDFNSSTGSVSWAWTMFDAAGAATEIRTQTLRLDVRELEVFDDSNPEPNHISEKAAPGDFVSGWLPRVLVRGVVPDRVRYRLSSDAGGLFRIDTAIGTLSLAPGQALDYRVSSSHQVTVAVDVPGSSAPPLAVAIDVRAELFIRDADTSANIIAATAAMGTNVGGVSLSARFGTDIVADGVVYSLAAPGGLFEVNPDTGVISSARQLRDSDRGLHPVTLMATYLDSPDSLPLTIEVLPGVSICDRTLGVRNEILDIINSRPGGVIYTCHAVLPTDLASISTLNLSRRLTGTEALLAHDFDGMTGLENLNLRDTSLTSLPQGIFSDTTNLRVLNLGNNMRLTSLPPDIFGNLGLLENLDMSSLGATSLPGNILSGTANLRVLNLAGSGLTSLPPDLFGNLGQLRNLDMSSLGVASLPENIFSGTANLRVLNLGNNRRLTSLSTGTFSNLGLLENLDMSSLGVTSLPGNILSGTANLRVLNLTGSDLTSLPPGIFGNLRQLQNLDMSFTGLASLPPNILMNLDSLENLDLSETPLSELPVHLLADLDRIRPRVLRVDADVRIGGVQYRAREGNAPITELTLAEGIRGDILIVPPDHSLNPLPRPVTLAFRARAESRLTAAPPTIRLLTNTVVVSLSADPDLILGDRSGPVSWAWRFNPAEADAVEIRTADLQVSVQETLNFTDIDPAPNRISETAMPGDRVSGFVPRYIVFGDILSVAEYGLSSDSNAGGLFEITNANSPSGAVTLAPGRRLDYTVSSSHEVTVIVTAIGGLPPQVPIPLTAIIEVGRALAISDTNSLRDTIAATAATGTPVAGVAPQTTLVRGGAIVTEGVVYALTGGGGLFTVSPTSGVILSARQLTEDDIGDYPVTLTAAYQSGLAHLPLTIEVANGVSVCGRTPVIRDEIMRLVNSGLEARYDCSLVPLVRLASILALNFSANPATDVRTLRAGDFDGLPGLTNLDLGSLGLRSLPPAVFRSLTNLSRLSLVRNNLASLPPDIFSGLGNLSYLLLGANNLASLPPDIFSDLSNLSGLSLVGNNLASLPPDIFSGLGNLSYLLLGANNLASLPPGIFSDLSNLSNLALSGNNLVLLPPGIFSTQTRLTSLSLSRNGLTSLPPDVFSGFTNLYILELAGNGNLVLPAQAAADLERQPLITLEIDRSARIGGIQYRLDGAAITQLALNEGESRNLQVKIDGGVGSTLTLVARTDSVPPRVVTPTTIRFSPLSGATDTAVVEMTPPADGDFEGSTGSVSWAWTVSIDGDIIEVRAPGLSLDVRDPDGLEDADPAPNQISETASASDSVSGWSPRVVVGGATERAVRYILPADAAGLFRIDSATGALSPTAEGVLDYRVSTFHQVIVAAEVTGSNEAATLAVVIEVLAGFTLRDADPSTNTIAANTATGTRVAGITPVLRRGSEVLTDGVMYSLAGPDLFAVNTASGVISAARQFTEGDVRMHPVTLTAIYRGDSVSLPLVIEVFSAVSICDRTLEVGNEILRVLSRSAGVAYTCDAVPPAGLASISTLAVPRQQRDVPALLAHDFAGMPALTTLTLAGLGLTSLPEGVFRDTTNLRVLNLEDNNLTSLPENIFGNLDRLEILNLAGLATTGLPEVVFSGLSNLRRLIMLESRLTSLPPAIFRNLGMLEYLELSLSESLTELPARLLADLEKTPPVSLGLDTATSRRIGGIRYRLNGATTTALTLNEGESRNLQIEAAGGVGSMLTLVFRTGAASRLTAMPTTVHLTASRRTAAVTLAAAPDLNTGDRSGPVSWAWTSFSGRGATEIPAPDLQVTVRDTHRFEDADPAPNRIGETAPAGVAVSGWSPRVLVGGVVQTNVRYGLSSDAGGLFEIDTASGALLLAPGQVLNHATTPSHDITVVAAAAGATASLAATIGVFTLALEDADPAANTIAATAAPGTPVSGVRPVLLVDGAAVSDGVFYTLAGPGLFTVHSTSGLISSAGALGGGGSHPVTLTAAYRGAPADLPLTIIVRAAAGFDICGRTPVVQREILYRVNTQAEVQSLGTPYECGSIPTTYMASVRLLDFSQYTTTVETLRVDDFDGLSGLNSLVLDSLGLRRLPPGIFGGLRALGGLSLGDNSLTSLPPGIFSGLPLNFLSLSGNSLTSLPPDIFSDLTSLDDLDLSNNSDLELPARAVADLEGLHLTTLTIDRNARIGGFRYLAGQGFQGNLLSLEEGDRLNLRLEVIGGVRSTLTLVLRLDNDNPQFTAAPTTVRFSPLSNTDTAVVELAAPADETIDPAATTMSWAWTMFPGPSSAATEIRTQRLVVTVNDNSGLVDTDPADNRISEAAFPGELVSGWSPQVLEGGVTATNVRYRLSLDAGGLFQIHPTSGTLSLASGRLLHYRNSSAHTVRAVARTGGDEWPLTTTILVDNVEELSLSGTVVGSIPETAATGTVVSGPGVSLLDEGVPALNPGEVVWLLSGAGSQVFQPDVRGSVAVLELVGALDYETTPVYTLTLRADYQRESVTTQITVRVLDAAESLTLEAAGPYEIGEDALTDALVGSVRTIDETGTPLTGGLRYTATGDGKFTVTNAGDIIVADQLDYEASTSHILFVTALQGRLVSNQIRVDIAVLDIANDLQLVDQSSAENIASNTTGGRVRGLDLVFQIDGVNQAGTASAWFLSDGSGLFDINSATGTITLREPVEFAPRDVDIFVAATWTGGDGVSREAPPLPLNVEVNDGIPVRIRVFLEGAVIP